MKKISSFLILLLLTTFSLWSVPYLVQDDAGLLYQNELQTLQTQAAELSQKYNCGIYIFVADDMNAYDFDYEIYSDAFGIEAFAQYVFFNYLQGTGSTGDGIFLVLNMDESDREYDIMAHGNFGNYAFTDYGKKKLTDYFLSDFKDGEWYRGFSSYLDGLEKFLQAAADGHPVDINSGRIKDHNLPVSLAAGLIFGLVVALISCLVMKSGMKSVHLASIASGFIAENGVNIALKQDTFLRNTVTRTPRQTSSSGGGGTRINSSGSSHHSGKF